MVLGVGDGAGGGEEGGVRGGGGEKHYSKTCTAQTCGVGLPVQNFVLVRRTPQRKRAFDLVCSINGAIAVASSAIYSSKSRTSPEEIGISSTLTCIYAYMSSVFSRKAETELWAT